MEEGSPSHISDSSQPFSEITDDPMNNLNSNMKDEFCGTSIKDLYYNNSPWNYFCPQLIPSRHHTVLFETPVNLKDVPKAHYSPKATIWDLHHVKMPFSPSNVFPVKENGSEIIKPRWEVIQCALLRAIKNSYELEEAILSYNLNLRRRQFHSLHYLFENIFSEEESDAFFTNLLPKIINLALRLPELIKAPIPLLKQGKPHAISLSQVQISSILANAFLCTFPWKKEHANYPGINFNGLYECQMGVASSQEILEKLKCILHYFRRVCYAEPIGVLTFERKHLPRSQFPRWDKVEKSISNTKLHVTSTGTIENDGLGMLQVDFANCKIGGGVLFMGCVQEEIRFVICPELIVSRLFTEELAPNEALLMIGAECYSHYTGYAYSFEWSKNCIDETPFDEYGRKKTSIIGIDAIPYAYKTGSQFAPSKMIRDLNKAYVGFHENLSNSNLPLAPVATGNWGCGAFGGNLHLKAIIQIMACTAANRNIVYYTFGDKKLQYDIFNIYNYLASNNVTVAQLWRYLCKFAESGISKNQFLPFIKQSHIDNMKNSLDDKTQNPLKKLFHKQANKQQRSPSPSVSTPRKTIKTTNKDDANIPSTSKEQNNEVDLAEGNPQSQDIIEASQEDFFELPIPENKLKALKAKAELSKIVSPNKFKRMRDVSALLYSSDEDEIVGEKGGFLSVLDNLSKPSNVSTDSKMEVDGLISSDDSEELLEVIVDDKKIKNNKEEISATQRSNKARKSLITDYFLNK